MAEARVSLARLRDFITLALTRLGLPAADAQIVGGLMAQAELQGSDGHGVIRLLPYARRIRARGINLQPSIKVLQERPGMALLDGDNAMGHLVMQRAAQLAIDKARTCGIAWVGSRLSNHAGPASLYARMPMAHDMIGLYFAVGNANHLPPWGGLDMLLSTNPIAVAGKLQMLDSAATLEFLRSPPGNRLEALSGNRKGQHSIRINDQWRVCFEWTDKGPQGVEIVDYH